MTRPLLPPDVELARRDRKDRERLARLARTDRLGDSAQQGGSHQLFAPDGSILFSFGDFDDADDVTRYGVAMYDGAGHVILAVDEELEGGLWPPENTAWGTTTPDVVTSGAFADQHSAYVVGVNGDVVYANGSVATDVGTTAEARIRVSGYDNTGTPFADYSNVVAIGSGAGGSWTFIWEHYLPIGQPPTGVPLGVQRFALETRRVSGAGNVYTYRPRLLNVGSSRQVGGAAPLASSLAYA